MLKRRSSTESSPAAGESGCTRTPSAKYVEHPLRVVLISARAARIGGIRAARIAVGGRPGVEPAARGRKCDLGNAGSHPIRRRTHRRGNRSRGQHLAVEGPESLRRHAANGVEAIHPVATVRFQENAIPHFTHQAVRWLASAQLPAKPAPGVAVETTKYRSTPVSLLDGGGAAPSKRTRKAGGIRDRQLRNAPRGSSGVLQTGARLLVPPPAPQGVRAVAEQGGKHAPANGRPISSATPEVRNARCVQDFMSGAPSAAIAAQGRPALRAYSGTRDSDCRSRHAASRKISDTNVNTIRSRRLRISSSLAAPITSSSALPAPRPLQRAKRRKCRGAQGSRDQQAKHTARQAQATHIQAANATPTQSRRRPGTRSCTRRRGAELPRRMRRGLAASHEA